MKFRVLNAYYLKHRNINVAANSSYLASAVQRLQNFRIWDRTQKKDVEKEYGKRKRMRHSRKSVNRKNAFGLG